MAKSYVNTEVKGQKLKLTNLEKVLYPEINVTKAEVIQYYLDVAPYLLKYLEQRPTTLIRFPDGIEKTQFYTKSRPKWAPQWIKSFKIQHSLQAINYIVPHSEASIVWLANLAALELHPMQMTIDDYSNPDHFIFDLDPPENGFFDDVKNVAFLLKSFLEKYNYNVFLKTSGSKGLHVFVPIQKKYSPDEMIKAVKSLAKIFVSQNKGITTLALNKLKRENKIFVDILRNHETHTTVAPYSLRGKKGAPISFPIKWEMLDDLKSSKDIHIKNYKAYLSKFGDAWKHFYPSATLLHSKNEYDKIDKKIKERLKTYIEKRDFQHTPEPRLRDIHAKGKRYCIQLHDASNLHYDLRLEDQGILLSWAIPKGLPIVKNVKRMAIKFEDHPLSYLTFEGIIPKNQYGAGTIWIYESGNIEWLEKKKDKYKFKLKSKNFDRTYNLFKTTEDHWTIQLLDINEVQLKLPIKPMLADQSKIVPRDDNYIYEIKWDGIRCIFLLQNDVVKIYSRSGREITSKFPELNNSSFFKIESGIFDGEIVCLDEKGKPKFSQVISRMHSSGEQNILKQQRINPVVCYLFDCLVLDGKTIINEPLIKRQAWLNCSLKKNNQIRISESFIDGSALFEATKEMKIEGIMAKKKNSSYVTGQRNKDWLKIKHRSYAKCYIAGYTKGEGDRSNLFGALHLLSENDQKLKYMGKVGTGFDNKKMKNLLQAFKSYISEEKTFEEKTDNDNNSVWLNPKLICKIQFATLSSNGTFREPVFIELLNK